MKVKLESCEYVVKSSHEKDAKGCISSNPDKPLSCLDGLCIETTVAHTAYI